MSSAASVRVCCRFRPVNSVEKSENARVCISIPQDSQVNIAQKGKAAKKFFLDHIFPPNSEQETVYNYTGRPLMNEILKGYNGTMFAYGQTGSGKTFTMEGDMNSERFMGLIPRMVNAIFDGIMEADEMEFVVKVSYVEIYCEKIQDLLDIGNRNLKIRESKQKGIYIEGVAAPFVGSADEILGLMEEGAISRACASTRMNETSSRSHAVFIFRLIGTNRATQTKKMSKLMMVDLAGSEKTRKTQATGKRLDEAKQINKSLSALGQVISALTTGKGHVPYRDSKLTRLLSDSLGGNSKTCIIVTCSPCNYNSEETISTLRFGMNCKRVKNKPKVNEELSIAEYKALVEKMKQRENRLLQKIAVQQSQLVALKDALVAAGGNVEEVLKNLKDDLAEALDEEKAEESRAQAEHNKSDSSKQPTTLAGFRSNATVELLKERVDELEKIYNHECQDKERYMDDAADARVELEQAEQRIQDLQAEKIQLARKKKSVDENVQKMTIALGELSMNKSKLELMQKEQNLLIQRSKQEIIQLNHRLKLEKEKLKEAEIRAATSINLYSSSFTDIEKDILERYNPAHFDFDSGDNKDSIERNYQELYKRLLRRIQKSHEEEENSKRVRGDSNPGGSDQKQNEEMLKLVALDSQRQREIKDLKDQNESMRKAMENMKQREKYNDATKRSWNIQLHKMEKAILLNNEIHRRDKIRWEGEISEKNSELSMMKMYLAQRSRRKRRQSRKTGRSTNVMVPVDQKVLTNRKRGTIL